jgi:hypothetical protein
MLREGLSAPASRLNATNELIVTSHTPPDFIDDCEIRIMAAANYPSAERLIWLQLRTNARAAEFYCSGGEMLQLSHLGGAKLIAPLCTADRPINHKRLLQANYLHRATAFDTPRVLTLLVSAARTVRVWRQPPFAFHCQFGYIPIVLPHMS